MDYIVGMTEDYFMDLYAELFPDDSLSREIKYVLYF